MCRFVLYLGQPLTITSLLLDPSHSLVRQSVHAQEREEPLNGDGFGVTWYAHEVSHLPASFRSISPAWSNRNLVELSRVTRSGCILAHVRAATQARNVSEANCHPFTHGPYAFMHNGDLGGFPEMRRALLATLSDDAFSAITGNTDSEHLFGLLIDHLADHPAHSAADLAAALVTTVERALQIAAAQKIEEPNYLNLAVTNGFAAAACRFTTDAPEHADTLYVHSGHRYVCEGGVCRMIRPDGGTGSAIVASEPLSDDPGWSLVPVNHLVLLDPGEEAVLKSWASLAARAQTASPLLAP